MHYAKFDFSIVVRYGLLQASCNKTLRFVASAFFYHEYFGKYTNYKAKVIGAKRSSK